ncbi:mechanosensitive ion channel family protein [Spirochaeta africana]|uniref:Small-conductance mechanosensitive channel n=1 Tax=Spirochaeta africana (strain ATCC 700263 / DSM 8902 / Z-7692) TaxID=889378 RepID=H9UIN9_SPIAZ|nr:mechanosensitive ion channel domain-containing protein [Spirochaeta africana]AFG37382.1 small-conductance mechanosensitive channel [Spirochaeta africana DSM 8902]
MDALYTGLSSIIAPLLHSVLVRGVILGAAVLIITRLLHAVLYAVLRHTARRRRSSTMELFVERTRKPTNRLALSIGLWASIDLLGLTPPTTEVVRHALILIMISLITSLAVTCIRAVAHLLVRQFDVSARDNLQARKVYTQVRVFEQIATVTVIIIAIASGLMTFDGIQQIGASILASAGIAGLVLGVAAQKSLANVIAGIMIAITQPIRLDDAVIIEGEWGRIEEITLTYVVVRIWDKRRLVVPITYFVDQPFQNWTRTSSDILGTVTLHLDYRMPVDELRRCQSEILSESDLWDGQVDVIQVTETTPTTMVVRCLVSAVDSPSAWDLRVLVRERLIGFLQREYPDYLPRTRIEASITERPAPRPQGVPE